MTEQLNLGHEKTIQGRELDDVVISDVNTILLSCNQLTGSFHNHNCSSRFTTNVFFIYVT